MGSQTCEFVGPFVCSSDSNCCEWPNGSPVFLSARVLQLSVESDAERMEIEDLGEQPAQQALCLFSFLLSRLCP